MARASQKTESPGLALLQPARRKGKRAEIEERIQAEHAFVREGRELREIALAHARPYSTIQHWARDGKWEDKRRRFLLSDEGSADILQHKVSELLLDLMQGHSRLTAPMAHTILVAKKAEREIRGDRYSLTQLFAVIQGFLAHLRAADPSLLPVIEPHVEAYLQAQREILLKRES
jgi:hypothetical protein